jgi:hypothetical protein
MRGDAGRRSLAPSRPALLWATQIALAALFVFAGAFKLIMPSGELADSGTLPVGFMRFIGAAELLGGHALALPAVVRAARILAPLAAAGLLIIMAGAVTVTVINAGAVPTSLPLAVGALLAFVLYGRRTWIVDASRPPTDQASRRPLRRMQGDPR